MLEVISIVAWIDAIIHVKSLRQAAGFFSLPCMVFILSTLFLYEVCKQRVFLSYDEHSHWGMMVKVIHLFNELPRAGRGAAYIQFTYPPSTAMIPALASSLLGYRDGIAYFGYAMLLEGLLLGLASRAGKWIMICAVALYMAMMAVFPLGAMRLFCEPVVALLMAMLIADGFGDKNVCSLEACLMAAMLAMTKSTGIVFLLIAIAVRLAVRGRRELRTSGWMLLCGVLLTLGYRLYCQVQGIEASMSPSHFQENLSRLLSGSLGEPYISVPQRFIHFLFSHPLSQAGVYTCYGFGTSAMVLGATMLLCSVHLLLAENRRQAFKLWVSVWLANLAYMAMIVISYYFFFEEWEVKKLSEADRYTMLIALWTAVLACTLIFQELTRIRLGYRIVAVCALLGVLMPLSHPEMTVKTFITRDYIHNTIWARDKTDKMTAFLKEHLAGMENVRLLCIGDYEYVELHYTMAGTADIGPYNSSWSKAPWAGKPERLRQALAENQYDAVFVAGLTSDEPELAIDQRYAVLTDDGQVLKPYSLYRVETREDGELCLRYWATSVEDIK